MKPIELIDRCLQKNRLTLDEAESKQLLKHYHLPVVNESIVTDADDAVSQGEAMGFPLVMKGLGSTLTHKTELGLVKINLSSSTEIRQAFADIQAAAGNAWEACVLQPMISGKREFVAGLTRDPIFGPVIMFGLGGIFAEALGDVAFRIAPITPYQAQQMIEELTSRKLLGNFRGEAEANKKQLIETLMGLSQIALDHPAIKEVDINPLIISEDGSLTAVDALIVLDDTAPALSNATLNAQADQMRTEHIIKAIHTMANPRSIAVIGVARTQTRAFAGMYRCIRNFGFPGRLYPIHPKTDNIEGAKAYPSLTALPEKVDLVVISVPGPHVPAALRDCVASGNKNIHIFSSGFKESGEKEGIRLQDEIEKIAIEGQLNIIGPNCMGIHVPANRLLTWSAAPEKSGPLAIVSQSGGNAQDFVNIAANEFGLYLSKVFSYGNALTLDSTDFLTYLAQDDLTKIIAVYIEGVKNGRKFLDTISRINPQKPVIVLKGGMTESGARTVASHTGALAGAEKIWQACFKQSGVTHVSSLEEMAETAVALHHLPPTNGRGVAILGTGGGIGVAAADSCARVGLELPALPADILEKLREYIPPAGNMIRNPIDAHIVLVLLKLLGPTLELLSAQPYVNMFILSLHLDWLYGIERGKHTERLAHYLVNNAHKYTNGKPLVVVWRQYQSSPALKESRKRLVEILKEGGIPVYNGLDRAVSALAKVVEYYEFQRHLPNNG